ncbi:hypothetical protein AVEN_83679-1 [Araneus ventricosus]|uniref:Uncharacterized protein n=1 Tax=Araneus ventricosus TaxID=182803 RepID=A0A4Y2EVB1_ARAVE|nr:hypothetical protein AVEN_83679-1 [Araneus ventricosus]
MGHHPTCQYPDCSQNSTLAAKVQVGIWSHPPYCRDLEPILGSKYLSGTRVSSDSEVKTAAENCLNGQRRDFYTAGLNKLVLRSDKCLNRFGDYVEK